MVDSIHVLSYKLAKTFKVYGARVFWSEFQRFLESTYQCGQIYCFLDIAPSTFFVKISSQLTLQLVA